MIKDWWKTCDDKEALKNASTGEPKRNIRCLTGWVRTCCFEIEESVCCRKNSCAHPALATQAAQLDRVGITCTPYRGRYTNFILSRPYLCVKNGSKTAYMGVLFLVVSGMPRGRAHASADNFVEVPKRPIFNCATCQKHRMPQCEGCAIEIQALYRNLRRIFHSLSV